MEFGLILIFSLPIILLILSLLIVKKVNVATITLIPNIILFGLVYFLDKIDSHSEIAKTITGFNFDVFNIIMFLFAIISTILLYVFSFKHTNSKSRTIINAVLYFIIFVIEFILIKIYFTCQ